MIVGPLVQVLREARGMTLADLGARTGRSAGYLSRLERNERGLSIATIRDLAHGLGVPIAVLTGQIAPIAAIRRSLLGWQGAPHVAEMAELLGVDFETYLMIENEQLEPTKKQLALIARRLGVPAALLWSLRTGGAK